ncbi:hypothetical protein NL526_29130, partial [Klebsiella pneumoniae]|nr:hypothetical protein [Klebsiella pneumoniae]
GIRITSVYYGAMLIPVFIKDEFGQNWYVERALDEDEPLTPSEEGSVSNVETSIIEVFNYIINLLWFYI